MIRHGDPVTAPGHPVAHSSGPDPYRILIVGGPRDDRIGVASHDLALGGHLARQLTRLTGHGVDVCTRARRGLRSGEVDGMLRGDALRHADAVVVMIGVWEVISGRPLDLWAGDVQRLISVVEEAGDAAPPVLVLGLPRFERSLDLPGWITAGSGVASTGSTRRPSVPARHPPPSSTSPSRPPCLACREAWTLPPSTRTGLPPSPRRSPVS
jgi:hypothetical protein